jgi:hypothetical protein
MPARNNKTLSAPEAASTRLNPTPAQKLVHGLGNSLSAARLRLGVVLQDPAYQPAQKANLDALSKILDDAVDETNRLDDLLWATAESKPPV